MTSREILEGLENGTFKHLVCFNGELVIVDADDWEWADQETWTWKEKSGACRNEKDSVKDYRVYLHREIMEVNFDRDERPERPERRGPLSNELCVGFLDGNKANCSRSNLFLFHPKGLDETSKEYREGNKLRAAARVRAGVFGSGTHNAPIGEEYETLGCVCGALTRVPVDINKSPDRKCRCSKCQRRLSKDSL